MTAPAWPPGPHRPHLHHGEIHLWRADLDATDGAALPHAVTAEDLRRAARILPPSARVRWLAARGLLRILLGRYLDLAPREVPLAAQRGGRPYLDGFRTPDVSLSHSRGLALYAVAATARVGVDVEVERGEARSSLLARRLGADPVSHPRELLGQWTRREAAVKCGCADPWLESIDLGQHAVGALACASRRARLRLWTLNADCEASPDSRDAERRRRPTGALI